MIIFDSDDAGADHVISNMCQSADPRKYLDKLHIANPNFKATLFTIPDESTIEFLEWCKANGSWIEIAQHGFRHYSNYECEKMTYDEFDAWMTEQPRAEILNKYFSMGFKSPGWQTSVAVFEWLRDHDFWVADQHNNDDRRPKDLPVYIVGENSIHTHVWNCVGNGIEETFDDILERIKDETDFRFVSEVVNGN